MRANSHGNRRILQELTQKGVDESTARQALQEAGEEQARATHAAQRFADKEMTMQLKAKAWRFLVSRGFSSDTVKQALKALESAERTGWPPELNTH